jgi:three-Cys-motif partner protein
MPPATPIWEISEHTKAKHAILRKYLGAWYPILGRWGRKIVFIDGFSGPGEYTDGESGSPIIALETAIDHTADLSRCKIVYLFIEEDQSRSDHLRQLIDTRFSDPPMPSNLSVHVTTGEFSSTVENALDQLGDKSLAPTFAMVDPFGPKGAPLSTIARIAEYEKCEVLFSLMTEPMVRFLNSPIFEPHMDSVFGTADWRDAQSLDTGEKAPFLRDLYAAQLKEIGFKYVPPGFELRDSGNKVEYYLMFGTNNLLGLEKMKDAMWSVDATGNYQFSDFKANSAQLSLLEDGPDYDYLRTLVKSRFSDGNYFSIETAEEFVLAETHFRKANFKAQVLKPLEQADQLVVVESPRKRPGYYPPGTIMKWC